MNTKNFKEVTRQVAVIKTQNRTLAIYANLRPVSIESGEDFMTIIDGKFKLDLNDFSNGKGDNAKHIQFNLDIKDIKYLYARAKMFDMPILILKKRNALSVVPVWYQSGKNSSAGNWYLYRHS